MKWATKYHGYYFCIFEDLQMYNHWLWKHRLLVFSEDGKDVVEVDLPKEFQNNIYGDLFVQHDTLFLRSYPFCDQNGYFFDLDLWKWQPVKVVCEDDQYNLACLDLGEWGDNTCLREKSYDTLIQKTFLMDNQLYLVVNTKENTYIAQLKDDKLHNIVDFEHRYDFFRCKGSNQGLGQAPNQCFLQFKENDNSYGVMEIQDKLIRIRHFIHNQDTLPYVGTDHIEPLLNFLLKHFDQLTYNQIDEKEKSLQATSHGQFQELTNGYYPKDYQTEKYQQINYYTVIDDLQMFTVDYCVAKSNSKVCGAFFDWDKNPKNGMEYHDYDKLGLEKQKVEELRHILTRLTGEEPVKKVGVSNYWLWKYGNVIIKLYEDCRLVMYRSEG